MVAHEERRKRMFGARRTSGLVLLFLCSDACAAIKAHNSLSSLTFSSGSTFVVQNSISAFSGTLNSKSGSAISGESIDFANGELVRNDGNFLINGSLAASGAITLSGNERLVIDRESPIESLSVNSSGNMLSGAPLFNNQISMQDLNTTLTVDLYGAMNKDIAMGNGTLFLGNDLIFTDDYSVAGSGICDLGRNTMRFGSKNLSFSNTVSWQNSGQVILGSDTTLSGTWVFNDDTTLSGNGNTLTISGDGSIIVSQGATLVLNDIKIVGISESSGSLGTFNLRCLDSNSSLKIRKSELTLSSNYSFTVGSINVENLGILGGSGYTWSHKSASNFTIASKSRLKLNRGFKFEYAASSATKTNLVMSDSTSELFLDACTLHGTTTGVRLDTGRLLINEKVTLSSDATVVAEAVEFSSALNIDVLSGAVLDVTGMLLYD